MIRLNGSRAGTAFLAIACVTGMAACSSSSTSTTASSASVKSGGTITYALDQDVAGFNVLNVTDNAFVLGQMIDQVWPSVYNILPNLSLALNTNVVTSVTVTNTNPQTIVYQINPKATWSDGVPISAQDFIYNWQSQSGNPAFKDVGGKTFLPANTAGYNVIKSVTSSNNGKTATVVFSKPFGDWKSLFGAGTPIIPAHIASKVGFNGGFQTFGPAVQVSGGPYEIQSYTQGEDLVEVPNPHYWGVPGKLSKIIFRFILDDSQIPPAMQNGEINLANPTLASTAFKDATASIPNTTTTVIPGLEFQHIDFNQANPYLALSNVRHAIADGTNRAQMVQRIVGPLTASIQPLQNRMWMPIQPQYQNTSGSYGQFNTSAAKALLSQSNMTMGSDGYFHASLCGSNWNHYANTQVDNLFDQAVSTVNPAQAANLYNQIDTILWKDMVTLPLFESPQLYSWSNAYGNIIPNPSLIGVPWNAQIWGMKA